MESISERTIVTGIHKNEYHKGFHQSRGYSPHLPVTAHKIPRLIYAPTLEATAISASATFDATFDESRLSFSFSFHVPSTGRGGESQGGDRAATISRQHPELQGLQVGCVGVEDKGRDNPGKANPRGREQWRGGKLQLH